MHRDPVFKSMEWWTPYGRIHVTREELREAGIVACVLPAWTAPGDPAFWTLSLGPEKHVSLLGDLLTLFAHEAHR